MITLNSLTKQFQEQNQGNFGFSAYAGGMSVSIATDISDVRKKVISIEDSTSVNTLANELALGETELIREDLHKLNATAKDILKLLRPSLDSLEAQREGKLPASFITGGSNSTITGGGTAPGGGGLGIGSMFGGAGLARLAPLLGRGLLLAGGIYASHELGDFLTELTGSQALGDVASWTGYGTTVGAMFGPGGALIGGIAGLAIGAGVALQGWMDERRAEFERDVNDTLSSMGAEASTPATEFFRNRLTPDQQNAISSMPSQLTPGITSAQAVDAAMEGMTPTERADFTNLAAAAQAGDPEAQAAFTETALTGYMRLQNQEYLAPVRATAMNSAEILSSQLGVSSIDPTNFDTVIRALTDFRMGGEAGLTNLGAEYNLLSNYIRDNVLQGMSTSELQSEGASGLGIDDNTFNRVLELSRLVSENGNIPIAAGTTPREAASGYLGAAGGGSTVVVNNIDNSTTTNGGGSTPAAAAPVNLSSTDTRFHYGGYGPR